MNKKQLILGLATVATLALFGVASADDNAGAGLGIRADIKTEVKDLKQMMRPEVVGKVTAVSGTTITVTGRNSGVKGSTATTFTVDASNATFLNGRATSTIGSVVVGNTIVVQGTLSGTNVTAKLIRTGANDDRKPGDKPSLQGNGQPVIVGKVTAVSGNTVTIMTNASTTFAVDATNAKVQSRGGASTLSSIAVGDHVVVQGTVNGSSVVATTILDQDKSGDNGNGGNQGKGGFFHGLGSFFKHLFGF